MDEQNTDDPFDLAAASSGRAQGGRELCVRFDDEDDERRFLDWYSDCRKKEYFRSIESRIKRVIKNAPPYWEDNGQRIYASQAFSGASLVRTLFVSCWHAHNYKLEGDPTKKEREASSNAEQTRADILTLAKKLSKRLKAIASDPEHPLHLNLWIASGNVDQEKFCDDVATKIPNFAEIEPVNQGKSNSAEDWVSTIYALEKAMSFQSGVGACDLSRYCLGYRKEMLPGRAASLETALAFDLSYHLRNYSERGFTLDTNSPMPTYGRPNWPLVADLVNLTLHTDLSGESSRDLVRQLIKNSNPIRVPWGSDPFDI